MKRLIQILIVAVAVVVPTLAPALAEAAGGATLALAPNTGTYGKGDTIFVSIYEDSASEPVNAANIALSFQNSQLDFLNVDSSSAFGVAPQSSSSGGAVTIQRGALPAVTGRQLVATVRFKVKAASGTTSINFANSSSLYSSKTNKPIATSNTGATYTLQATGTASLTSSDKIAPTIKNINVSAITGTSATVNWETSEPATSEVMYGLDTNYGLTSGGQELVTVHKVVLNTAALKPSSTYHYTVKSVDAAGNATSSKDMTFSTKGVSVVVKVIDQDNKPVSGATVQIGNVKGETDSNGNVTLDDLKIGKATAKVSYKGNDSSKSVDIKGPDASGKPQRITLTVSSKSDTTPFLIIAGLIVLLLGGFLYARRDKGGNVTPAEPVPIAPSEPQSPVANSQQPATPPSETEKTPPKDSPTMPEEKPAGSTTQVEIKSNDSPSSQPEEN